MTNHNIFFTEPNIGTNSTHQVRRHVNDLNLRRPEIEDIVIAIRNGDNDALLALVRRSQSGDGDASVVAICALLPRLCAVIINRTPMRYWQSSVDDYVAIAYLVINDVGPFEDGDYLADKIIARTRRRFERYVFARRAMPFWDSFLVENGLVADDIEQQALARVELDALHDAVQDGLLTTANWLTVLSTQFAWEPNVATGDRQRQVVSRARQRLNGWRADTQAA